MPSEVSICSTETKSLKTIDTLVEDINKVLVEGISPSEEHIRRFSDNLAKTIAESLSQRERKTGLRMSNIGKPCARQLWYECNSPNDAEAFTAANFMKFMYGHLVEELLLFLCELAGHEVTGRQDTQEIEGILGHRDAVISGTLADAKSASSFSFKKFVNGLTPEEDSFGYIPQIQSYLDAGQKDPIIQDKDRAAFLVLDKTLGHITLDVHQRDTKTDWKEFYRQKKEMVKLPEPPERGFEAIPMGQSGNMMLGFNCSYCPLKRTCWKDANDGKGIRTFLYSHRPVDLVVVKNEPRVPEIKEEVEDAPID